MAINVNTKAGWVSGAMASKPDRNFMNNHLERLASGRRINSAADDAAGIAVLSKLEAELSGKERAIKNAADGQSALGTADAGAAEVSNILNRVRELAVQAANGTNTIAEREAMQSEAQQLTAQINRIAENTSFNSKSLLNGAQMDLQVGATAGEKIDVKIGSIVSEDLGLESGSVTFETNASAREAIGIIDKAIETVNSVRSEIGAASNQISSTISSLSHSAKNTKIAAGRTSDADFAEESKNKARAQILQHSSIALMAQKNASKGGILKLI